MLSLCTHLEKIIALVELSTGRTVERDRDVVVDHRDVVLDRRDVVLVRDVELEAVPLIDVSAIDVSVVDVSAVGVLAADVLSDVSSNNLK